MEEDRRFSLYCIAFLLGLVIAIILIVWKSAEMNILDGTMVFPLFLTLVIVVPIGIGLAFFYSHTHRSDDPEPAQD